MPVTVTRVPGAICCTPALSTISTRLRGISPAGTLSGASCSFSVCWSTKGLLDTTTS